MSGMAWFAGLMIGLLLLVLGRRALRWGLQHRPARDPLRRVFGFSELRQLDDHLNRVAELEQLRIDATVARYVAGFAGHVVVVSETRHGVALGLSDGCRLVLGGVSRSTLSTLRRRAASTKLYPARVEHDHFCYRLHLRDETGVDLELNMRQLALAL